MLLERAVNDVIYRLLYAQVDALRDCVDAVFRPTYSAILDYVNDLRVAIHHVP